MGGSTRSPHQVRTGLGWDRFRILGLSGKIGKRETLKGVPVSTIHQIVERRRYAKTMVLGTQTDLDGHGPGQRVEKRRTLGGCLKGPDQLTRVETQYVTFWGGTCPGPHEQTPRTTIIDGTT